jgi:hypothetical protein
MNAERRAALAVVTTMLQSASKALGAVINDERFAFDQLETTNLNATRKSRKMGEVVVELEDAERLIDQVVGTIEDARR